MASEQTPELRTSQLAAIVDAWLAPVTLESFMSKQWAREPLFCGSSDERTKGLAALLGELSGRQLLSRSRGSIRAWYEDGGRPDYSLLVSTDQAWPLYRAGLTIYFDFQERTIAETFAAATGQLAHRATLSAFLSRTGRRTLAHIDGNENFTLQISGCKRWRYYFDPLCQTSVEDVGEALRLSSGLADAPWTELTPGSMLYMPSGWVHETETLEDSLSLTVTIRPVFWADVVLGALRGRLLREPRWRAYAHVGAIDSSPELKDLLGRLASLEMLNPVDLSQRTSPVVGAETMLVRNAVAYGSVMRPPQLPGHSERPPPVLNVERNDTRTSVILDPAQMPLAAWAATQRGPFTARQMSAALQCDEEEGLQVLEALVESGLLRPYEDMHGT